MSADVLLPRDCLVDRIRFPSSSFHHHHHHHRHRRTEIVNNGNSVVTKPVTLRKSKKLDNVRFNAKKSPICDGVSKNRHANGLVNGQVTILKRGESLDSILMKSGSEKPNTEEVDLIVSGTERMTPEPKQVKIRYNRSVLSSPPPVDMYAGSAVSVSPSPSSLPVPSFFSKKQISRIVLDSATKELCRILRLE